ncbi:MAG: hypothetical protein K0U16_07435 [Gammaproteobacteria bacterium]|nr:hypothetical protein [Gammaproteobacteria bacterium]
MAGYQPHVTTIQDGASANRFIMRITDLDEDGEITGGPTTDQVEMLGIIGSPEGRALGSPGDVRLRTDVAQIWQKITGVRTRTGWQLVGAGTDGVTVQQDGTTIASRATLNFTGSVTVTDDAVNERVDIAIGTGLQESLAQNNVYRLLPASVGVAPLNLGIPNVSSGGVTHPALGASNLMRSTPRTVWTSLVGTGNTSGHRSNVLLFFRGDAAGLGGFEIVFRFAQTAFATGHRAFVGLRAATAAIPAVNPSTLTNIIGMGYDLGNSQWEILHNDAAGSATSISLGTDFDVDITELLELRLQADPNASTVNYRARNLTTGAEASGVLSTDLPADTEFLSTNAWANTGSDATTAAEIALTLIYAQT